MAPGRYRAEHQPWRLVIAAPAAPWPVPAPQPEEREPALLLIQPPYYLALSRAVYDMLRWPSHIRLRHNDRRGWIFVRACAAQTPGALQVQRAEGRHPRVVAAAFFKRTGIDVAAMHGAYPATRQRGWIAIVVDADVHAMRRVE